MCKVSSLHSKIVSSTTPAVDITGASNTVTIRAPIKNATIKAV